VIYYEGGFENYISLLKRLQDEKIDLAIVPSTVVFSGTNHLIAYHSKASVTAGVRSKDYEKNPVWYLLKVKNDFYWGIKKIHQIQRSLDIIRQLNIEPSVTQLNLELSNESKLRAGMFFRRHFPDNSKKVIGFHPGAGKETNVWPAEKFAELAHRLSSVYSSYIFISEGPADEKYVNQMKSVLAEKYGIDYSAVHKGELMTNAAIIDKLNLFVTNDTGMMHAASGLKAPMVALFGETMAYEWGPLGDYKISIQSPDGMISGISVDSVFNACARHLS
jgi:ADP-heptose:LPS heptosyltransferase